MKPLSALQVIVKLAYSIHPSLGSFFLSSVEFINIFQIRTVPNDLRFWLFMHFKKVSRKETVFNQSNGRKFKNSLFAQGNLLTEQRDYF